MSRPPSHTESPDALLAHAESLMALRRYADALPWLGRAIAAEPDTARPHCLLALALFHLKEFPRAMEAAERAAAVDPADEWPHRLRSIILLATGRRRQALQAAETAARLAPDTPWALCILAHAQVACRKHREAQARAERMARLAPDLAATYETLATVALARQDWKAAEAHLHRALALDPHSYEAMNDLGLALQGQGRVREAIERLHEAVRLDPAADTAQASLHSAVLTFLRPSWRSYVPLIVALLAVGVLSQALHSPLLYWLVIAVSLAGWLFWRRRRLRGLPEPIQAFVRRHRWWAPGTPSAYTVWVWGFIAAVILGLALLGVILNGRHYSAGDWIIVLFAVAVTSSVFALTGWRRWRGAEAQGGAAASRSHPAGVVEVMCAAGSKH